MKRFSYPVRKFIWAEELAGGRLDGESNDAEAILLQSWKAMDFIRRSFTVLGTIFFAVLVLGALAPKAARGVATALAQATPALVQVANTSATPVLVNDPARQGVTLVAYGPNVDFSNWFSGTTYIVPVGQRLVVEDISGSFNTPTGSHISHSYVQPFMFQRVTADGPGLAKGSVFHHFVPQLVTQGNFNIYKFQQKTWFYADANVHLLIDLTGGDPVTGVEVTLQGHLVDCTNAFQCAGWE
jgi:hypothetical protein